MAENLSIKKPEIAKVMTLTIAYMVNPCANNNIDQFLLSKI